MPFRNSGDVFDFRTGRHSSGYGPQYSICCWVHVDICALFIFAYARMTWALGQGVSGIGDEATSIVGKEK